MRFVELGCLGACLWLRDKVPLVHERIRRGHTSLLPTRRDAEWSRREYKLYPCSTAERSR